MSLSVFGLQVCYSLFCVFPVVGGADSPTLWAFSLPPVCPEPVGLSPEASEEPSDSEDELTRRARRMVSRRRRNVEGKVPGIYVCICLAI